MAREQNHREMHFREFVRGAAAHQQIPLRELISIRRAALVIEDETDTLVSAAGYERIRTLIDAASRPSTLKVHPVQIRRVGRG
jgi:hypothetical protein